MAFREAARWITSRPAAAEMTETRPLTTRNFVMLWAALCMSLFAFVPGAYLVPALRLRDAIAVALLGSLVGGAVLGAVAATAASRRKNTVGLLSSTLGVPAGGVIAVMLLVRHIVWATFTLAFAANVAAHVPGLGGGRGLWGVALGALALALALLPPRTFVERWLGWFAFWIGLLLIAAITVTGITTYGIPVLHDADGMGGWPTRAQGFDLIAALPLLWLPVVADYATDARRPRDAFAGAFAGAGVMSAWYTIVGVFWVFTVSSRDVAGFIASIPIGAGALVIVIALQSNAVAANVYSASLAGGRFGYRWFRPALFASAIAAGAVVVATDALNVEDFALLLAAIFLPLFAVVLARAVLGSGPQVLSWLVWAAGVLVYGWINPGDFSAWHRAMNFVFSTVLHAPFPLGGELTVWPATAVSFAAAFGGYLVLASIWNAGRAVVDRAGRAA
jgi:NCS1 family nucleobase:cation symporter-1